MTKTHAIAFVTSMTLLYGCAADDSSSRTGARMNGFDNSDVLDESADATPMPENAAVQPPQRLPPQHPPLSQSPAPPLPDPTTPDAAVPSVPPQQDAAKIVTAVGMRNFRQINQTMSHLTGVAMTEPTVLAAYRELETQLPDSNDIRAFIGSHQVAITKLAVEYCDRMVETPARVTALLNGFSLTQTPAVAFSSAGKANLAKALIDSFWGTGMETSPDASASLDVIEELIDEILASKSMTDVNVTKNVVKGVCSAVLSSGPVTFL